MGVALDGYCSKHAPFSHNVYVYYNLDIPTALANYHHGSLPFSTNACATFGWGPPCTRYGNRLAPAQQTNSTQGWSIELMDANRNMQKNQLRFQVKGPGVIAGLGNARLNDTVLLKPVSEGRLK